MTLLLAFNMKAVRVSIKSGPDHRPHDPYAVLYSFSRHRLPGGLKLGVALSFSTQQMYEAGYSYAGVKVKGRSLVSHLARAAARIGHLALGQRRS